MLIFIFSQKAILKSWQPDVEMRYDNNTPIIKVE